MPSEIRYFVLKKAMHPPSTPWNTLSKKSVYNNPWIEVEEHTVTNANDKEGIYGVVRFKNYAIGILPLDDQANIWLVGQHRYPFNEFTWEIPEGGGPLHIDPLESAKREWLEETGLKSDKWTLIQQI